MAAHVRMVAASIPAARVGQVADRYTREADEEDTYGPRNPQERERIAVEDCTLVAGVPTEEVLLSLGQGWAVNESVAQACEAYRVRKHAPYLMENDDLEHLMRLERYDRGEDPSQQP